MSSVTQSGKRSFTSFVVTNHARDRFREKFPKYNYLTMPEILVEAHKATYTEFLQLEVQNIEVTRKVRRSDKTLYFLWKNVVFVCEQSSLDEIVVVTCWNNELDYLDKVRRSQQEKYNMKKFVPKYPEFSREALASQ